MPRTNILRQTIRKATQKVVLMLALFLTLGTTYSFAKPVDSITGGIKTSFAKNFRKAQIMDIEVHATFTKLTFKMNGMVMFAFYAKTGELLAVTHNILSSQLPISLLMSLKNDYNRYWVTELFELTGDTENAYYISLENADTKIALRSNGDTWEIYSSVKK